MSEGTERTIVVTCPKCKAEVVLETRDDEHLNRKGFSVPSECIVVNERIIQGGQGVIDPVCWILEDEKAKAKDKARLRQRFIDRG